MGGICTRASDSDEAPDSENVFYWGVHQQAELDVLVMKSGQRIGFSNETHLRTQNYQIDAPVPTLKLDRLTIVFRGDGEFPLAERILARGLNSFRNSIGVEYD